MTELFVGINTEAELLCVGIYLYIVNMFEIHCKHIVMADLTWWCMFIHLTTRPSADGTRALLTAIILMFRWLFLIVIRCCVLGTLLNNDHSVVLQNKKWFLIF